MRILALCFLLSALCSAVNAQGFLPPKSTTTVAGSDAAQPLLIGQKVPDSLTVTDTQGRTRSLLSYKSPTEVMVVAFFSARCASEQTPWAEFRRLNDRYKEWKVALVAINVSSSETLPELSKTFNQERLPWPVLQDDERASASLLKIMGTPEVLVIDEYGVLKYRGPVSQANVALDTVIGHIETVKNPEPPFEGKCPL